MFARSLLALLPLSFGVLSVSAQTLTPAQVQACARSAEVVGYQESVEYAVDDDSHFYNATISYGLTECLGPPQIPVLRVQVVNLEASAFITCPISQFDDTGLLYVQCPITLGEIARSAQAGEVDWGLLFQVGARPVTVFTQWDTIVTGVDPAPPAPEPSNTRKRQLARAQQPQFSCLPGQSYCWTGRGKNFACVNTSSDVASCGSCPYSEESTDCSSIEGVDNVTCRDSRCLVSSCEKGYQVSTDRASCVRVSQKRVDSRFWTR